MAESSLWRLRCCTSPSDHQLQRTGDRYIESLSASYLLQGAEGGGALEPLKALDIRINEGEPLRSIRKLRITGADLHEDRQIVLHRKELNVIMG